MKVGTRCVISGRVQGVFYRQSALRMAQALGVNGWIKNLSDGNVELFAVGDEADIERFKSWLWRGPITAKVERVDCSNCDHSDPGEFTIVYDE